MNRIYLESTTFVNHNGSETYGYRFYDDYEKTYCNLAEAPITDDMDLLRFAVKMEDDSSLINYIIENEKSIEINGTLYKINDIESIIKQGDTE